MSKSLALVVTIRIGCSMLLFFGGLFAFITEPDEFQKFMQTRLDDMQYAHLMLLLCIYMLFFRRLCVEEPKSQTLNQP